MSSGGRRELWHRLSLFLLGCLAGGALTGLVLGFISTALGLAPNVARSVMLILIIGGLILLTVAQLAYRWVSVPGRRYQLPVEVLGQDTGLASLQFGFELGLGFRTYVTTWAPYTLSLLVIGSSSGLSGGILVGAGFGFGRWLTPVLRLVVGAGTWDSTVVRIGSGAAGTVSAVVCGASVILLLT